MTGRKTNGRLVGLVVLVLALLSALGFWVITAQEFADGEGKPLIGRLQDGLRGRLGQLGVISVRRPSSKKKASPTAAKKAAEPTGPVVIRVVDGLNAPIPDAKILLRSHRKTLNQRTDKAGRVSLTVPVDSYHVIITHPKYSAEERTHQQVYGARRG